KNNVTDSVLLYQVHLLMFRHFLTPQQTEQYEGHLYIMCKTATYTNSTEKRIQTQNRQALQINSSLNVDVAYS
ncbi:MAG: hypothetical protein ACRCVV_20510, partial [Shewanella sp.]